MLNIQIDIQPFPVPDSVTLKLSPRPRQEGFIPAPSMPLAEVDEQTLSDMCDEFRKEVFRKAGKADPKL